MSRICKMNSSTFKAAQKPVVVFVTHLEPQNTKQAVVDIVKGQFSDAIVFCEKLITRHTFYNSFSKLLLNVYKWKKLSSHTNGHMIFLLKIFSLAILSETHTAGKQITQQQTIMAVVNESLSVINYNCQGLPLSLFNNG